jgi:hypothetical protein
VHEKTVYSKSAKGREEIATRAHKLGFKQRAFLIMVDGTSTVAELAAKAGHLGDVASFLTELLDRGFIGPVSNAEDLLAHETPVPSVAASEEQDFAAAKTSAAHFLEAKLGPDIVDAALKLEECETPEQFLEQVEAWREILTAVAGADAADEFWRDIVERLG